MGGRASSRRYAAQEDVGRLVFYFVSSTLVIILSSNFPSTCKSVSRMFVFGFLPPPFFNFLTFFFFKPPPPSRLTVPSWKGPSIQQHAPVSGKQWLYRIS